jgi:hypothetical protein
MTAPIPAGATDRARPCRDRSVLRLLPAVTLAAVVTVTSTSEWTLARTVLDLPPAVAWAVPVAIDSYVIAALRTRRDVLPAVIVMAGALASAMGAHLAAAGRPDGTLPATGTAPAAAVILSVLVIVAWRVHVLIDHLTGPVPGLAAVPAPASTGTAAPASAPAPIEASTPRPSAQRDGHTSPAIVAQVDEAAGTGRSGGSGAAAPRDRHHAPATPSATTTDGRNGLSDEQILAELNGVSPGIRALKRTYAIGQPRASRIHQRVTDQPSQNSKTAPKNTTTRNHKEQQRADSATSEEFSQERTDSTDQTTSRIRNQETHIGITDRVGPSHPTADSAAGAEGTSRNGIQRVGGA